MNRLMAIFHCIIMKTAFAAYLCENKTAGLRADLLVLSGNPLEDITQLRDINLVVVQGVPYAQSELTDMLDQLASANYR